MTLIFIGSLTYNRLLPIIELTPILQKKFSNLNIIIIGDGPDNIKYLKTCKDLNTLNKNIFFKGSQKPEQIPLILDSSDIAYSDDWSQIGFPMKVFEYMAAGKAIIVEDTKAVREIIKDGENGLLYKDKEDLLGKITMLVKDEKLRKRLGINAKKDVFRHHTWSKRIKKLTGLLR
jgi:glycosyltransferase involved in cell wall biosynthesis